MWNRRRYLIGATSVAALAAAPVVRSQGTKTVLKLGWATADSTQDPAAIGARAFKKALEAASNGTLEVQLYPNRQLGDDKPLVEGLRFGTVDAAVVTNAVVAQLEPSLQVIDLPFLFANEAQAHEVLDGPAGAEMAKRLDGRGITLLGFLGSGFRHMINNKKPIQKPADVAGVKFRVMQSPVYIDMFNALGGAAVPMAWGETLTAVQQGMVDGLELPLGVTDSLKVYEVTKYLSQTNHTYTALDLLVSKRTMAKLTAEQRKAVLESGKRAVTEQREANGEQVRKLLAVLEGKGMQINTVADPAAFRKAVAPVYEKYRAAIGSDLLDLVLKQVN
jgi:tripartite ATP-independent transporter DctP family solute receptor